MVCAPFSAASMALLFVAVTALPLRQENTASRDTLIPVDPTPSTTAPDGDGYGQGAAITVRLGSAGFSTKRPSIRGITDGLPDSANDPDFHESDPDSGPDSEDDSGSSESSSTNKGAIAGGTAGGAFAVLVILMWWYQGCPASVPETESCTFNCCSC
ncbi:hypothetical protein C8F04DRAFT_1395184, partial [Mycena alexandri]